VKDPLAQTRFVVQEHHARQRHYDFRLEMAGVLKSWAVPKGPSMNAAEKRLAVMVEDHPIAYLDFEGIIPAGQSGAGPVVVWDQGTYELLEGANPVRALEAGKMVIALYGGELKGSFTLVQMKGRGAKHWLLIKKKDEYSRTDWTIQQRLTKEKRRNLREKVPPCESH